MTREEAKEFIAQSVKSDVDMATVADAIKALEQEPKTGHWKYIGNGHNGLFKCDNCGTHRNMFDELEKYCYTCGAKMVEPQESEANNET